MGTQGSLQGELSAEDSEDFRLLEVSPAASKDEILASFRRKALQLHKHGHCVDVDQFHLLNNACQRRVTYGGSLPHVAFTSATDPLAVHLLVGADPRESRYREPSLAILD